MKVHGQEVLRWPYASVEDFKMRPALSGIPFVGPWANRLDELKCHPTVKPVALVADLMMDCTSRGEVVLDGFLGSGTNLIAAERTGRRCYGIELDPLYVDTSVRRWQSFTRDRARHAVSGRDFNDLEVQQEQKP